MGYPDFEDDEPTPPRVKAAPSDLAPVVGVDLALDTRIGVDYRGDPITLGDRVAEIMAERLLVDAGKEWYPNVAAKANEIARELVSEKFADVLEREFVPTDQYGSAKGERTTIAEMIVKTGEEWMGSIARGGSSYDRETNLTKAIKGAVDSAFKSTLKKTVEKAQAAVLQQVANETASAYTEILQRAVKGVTF